MAESKFRLLEIDLTSRTSRTIDVTDEMKKYCGGRGMGAKILWDRVPKGADPFSPENVLYFGTGPLTGLCGAVVNVTAKSPLTMLCGKSNVTGHWGAELVNAGYNAGLLLTGKADKPVWIYIKDDVVEIRDASHLWGNVSLVTENLIRQEIRKELDDQNFRIVSIGPGGEHLVRNALISHDFYHVAARTGMGAVMGAKNVKAIAVRSTHSGDYYDPTKLFNVMLKLQKEGGQQKAADRRWGHSISMSARYYDTTEGVKNKQLGWDPMADLCSAVRLEQQYKLFNDACQSCHIACKVPYMRRDPPLGPVLGEARHDNAGGWNANVMIPGFDTQVYLTAFVDYLGLDSEDVSGVVAWMMECYQRGLITKDELGGIDLTWGNLKAICELLEKITYREGIGDILADGLKFAPKRLNKPEAEKYAITRKGVAITSYELRGSMRDAIFMALNPCGELHHMRSSGDYLILDSLTCCVFYRPTILEVFNSIAVWGKGMLNAAVGWQLSDEDWDNLVQRTLIMERCYSLREGHVPLRDDWPPDRFFDETIYSKYGEPKKLDRAAFEKERESWYLANGLSKEGMPTRDTLKKLDMEFVMPVLGI
jgi:aldehyde:ferredoxin oxidoreductase